MERWKGNKKMNIYGKDIRSVLMRGLEYDDEKAWEVVKKELVEKI
jgi:hypothetical protein